MRRNGVGRQRRRFGQWIKKQGEYRHPNHDQEGAHGLHGFAIQNESRLRWRDVPAEGEIEGRHVVALQHPGRIDLIVKRPESGDWGKYHQDAQDGLGSLRPFGNRAGRRKLRRILHLPASRRLAGIMARAQPENQRGQAHEDARNAESPAVTPVIAHGGNNQKGGGGAQIDGPVKPGEDLCQQMFLVRAELVPHESGDIGLDPARADGNKGQAGIDPGAGVAKKKERAVSETIKKRNAQNRPVTPQPSVGHPAADQGQKINRGPKKMIRLRRLGVAHVQLFGHVVDEDASQPVIAETLAGFVADDIFDLRRETIPACRGRRGGGFAHGR